MTDKLGRDITYLRISLTDKCNLRCRYCMPEEGVCRRSHHEMMNEDEVVTAVEVAASLGIPVNEGHLLPVKEGVIPGMGIRIECFLSGREFPNGFGLGCM